MVHRTLAQRTATALLLAVRLARCANPAAAQDAVQGIMGPAGGARAASTPPVNGSREIEGT